MNKMELKRTLIIFNYFIVLGRSGFIECKDNTYL